MSSTSFCRADPHQVGYRLGKEAQRCACRDQQQQAEHDRCDVCGGRIMVPCLGPSSARHCPSITHL